MVITAQECAPSVRAMETWTAEDVHIWLKDQMYVSNSAMVAKSALTAGLTGQDLQLLDSVALEALGITHPLEQVRVKAAIKNFTPDDIKNSTAYQIPVVNIFFDLLFDDSPPSNEQLKDMLNTFGLLAALLLTVAISIPASFDYDELDDALERFEVAPRAAGLFGPWCVWPWRNHHCCGCHAHHYRNSTVGFSKQGKDQILALGSLDCALDHFESHCGCNWNFPSLQPDGHAQVSRLLPR
jgi:hypothetical protein